MPRLGIKVIGAKGTDSLIPLLRVPKWLQDHMIVAPTLEDQLHLYLNYIDSIKTEEHSQFVETFSEDEEADLLSLYSGNTNYYASVITDFYVSRVVRKDDPDFSNIAQSHSSLIEEGEEFYSFVVVSEKSHREIVFERIEKLRENGYELKLELLEQDD